MENDQMLAFAVPVLKDEDLSWMDSADAERTIVANYQAWEDSRQEAVALLAAKPKNMSLAQILTRKAKGATPKPGSYQGSDDRNRVSFSSNFNNQKTAQQLEFFK